MTALVPRWRSLALLAGVLAVGATATLLPSPAQAVPHPGVPQYNQKVCGRKWLTVRTKESYFRISNGNFGPGSTGCLSGERHHLDFQVLASTGTGFHASPEISSGWESGIYSCTGRGHCFTYPVQVGKDGAPVTSIAYWLAPGRYDASYDIWTNKTDAHPVQDNGTEVMIWLAHPGIPEGITRTVKIDGIEWNVTTWMTHHPGEPSWRLLIYYAARPRSSAYGLRLNDFFREAERHGELSPSFWLTGIDAGFELVQGGVHNNVHDFSLAGVR